MKISRHYPYEIEEIQQLFTKTFTDSEGQAEGLLIGNLVAELMTQEEPAVVQCYIAKQEEEIIGCIFFSKLTFENEDINACLLSPVAVHTAHQGRGIGQQLIRFGLNALKEAGVSFVFTYGDIHFYSKVGFQIIDENVAKAPVKLSYPQGWLAQSLQEDTIKPIPGRSVCVETFNKPEVW